MKPKTRGLFITLLITLFIAVLSLTLSSCSDDDGGAVADVFGIIYPTTEPYSWHTAAFLATTGSQTGIFSFHDNDPNRDTITRPAGDFTADGFAAGQEIMVVGSQSNEACTQSISRLQLP